MSKVLGIIPARGGSKGIPRKNLRLLLGKPLIAWSAEALLGSKSVDKKMCSTDDEEIAAAATKLGLEVPGLRPAHLATDEALIVDVLKQALELLQESQAQEYEYVALVQATSPTVRSEDIDAAVDLAVRNNADTVITGFAVGQRHPSTMFSIADAGNIDWLLNDSQRMARRQELGEVFVRTGLIYVIRSDLILDKGTIYGDRIFAHIIPENRALTIDDEYDFKLAEFLLGEEIRG